MFDPRALRMVLITLAAFATSAARGAALPVAPLTFDTSYAAPPGQTISVPSGGNFQAALNSAQLGDTIVLQAGATYTGPFTLPDKTSGSGWIYVVSSNYAALPSPGQRVAPSDAANMPLIVGPANSNAIITVADSNHFRFVGIDFSPVSGAFLYNLITIGNNDQTPTTLPNNIVFDRCYVHGDPTGDDIRGIELDGAYVAVIDSYISDFMAVGSDTQGLWAYNTSGPIKISDDYIEAAGENVMFGGADSKAPSLVPADIQITNNYFFKPLSWIGTQLDVKNLLEFKAAERVLVSGNTFVNNPAQAQDGFALLVTPRNQDGTAPWSVTSDIDINGNAFINVGSGINILGTDNEKPSVETQRVLIRNNVLGVTGLNNADGRGFQIIGGGTDITIDHNTIIDTAAAPSSPSSDLLTAQNSSGTSTQNFVFTNNISTPTTYGFFGSGVGTGTAALNGDFSNWSFVDNAIVGASADAYPSSNFFPATLQAVGFKSYSGGPYTGGDVSLATSSPYKNAGTDGLDIGANLTSSVVIPSPPAGLTVH